MAYRRVKDRNDAIIKLDGEIFIPEGNRLWDDYQLWIAAGNVPAPAETTEQQTARLTQEVETQEQENLRADLKADAIFDALKTATPAQISTFVNNQFATFTAQQRATMKMLIQVAALVIRRL